MERTTAFLLYILPLLGVASCQLVVNIRNGGGDLYQQSIHADTDQNTITLEFQKTDGTLITQFIDFTNEVQVFRVVMLGEEERGQTAAQTFCLVTHFVHTDFISSDAMSKLRQKNPGAVRHPEEERSPETLSMELVMDLDQAHLLSPTLPQFCAHARDAIHTRDQDLKEFARGGKDYSLLLGATRRSSLYRVLPCPDVQELWRPCLCHYRVCVGWYPCGLKYCKGNDSAGKVVSYRCGIKTCGKCREFEFFTRRKQQCIWDERRWGVSYASAAQELGNNLAAPQDKLRVDSPMPTGDLYARPIAAGVQPQAAGVQPLAAGVQPQSAGGQPLAAGGQPQAVGGQPIAAGVQPLAAGVQPLAAGVQPLAAGVQPQAAGGQPVAAGVQPLAAGVQPQAAGVQPLAAGGQPQAAVVQLLAAGDQPLAAGVQPQAAGVQPLAAGVQPSAAGVQPLAAGGQPVPLRLQVPIESLKEPLTLSVHSQQKSPLKPNINVPMDEQPGQNIGQRL